MARELILKLGKKITDRVDVKLGMTQLDETSPEYYGLASVVTDEMAELALAMKVRVPTTPAEIGKKVGKDPVYVEQLFDQMSMIGLLEYNWENADHHKQWTLPIFVPGSAELMNMNLQQVEEHPEIAQFFERMAFLPLTKITCMVPPGGAGVGMHVWSDYPAGTVALRKGPMMASGDQFKIHVRGKSTHGAQPQLGADALIMGAAIAQNLQTIVSRETYPGDTAVVTVGKFHSGTRFNVVAGTAELEGTTRTFSPAVRDRFEEQITRIARSTAEAMRGTADVEYLRIVPVTVNDPGMIDVVTGAAGKIFGDKGVIEADLQMGGEDFAFYQEKVPGAMVLLGVRNEACDAVWPQHHGCYKVDESVLVKGAALHVQTALDFLGVDLQ